MKLYVTFFFTDILLSPSNIQLKHVSRSTIEVTWEKPATAGISGYQVRYGVFSTGNSDKWLTKDVGAQTVVELRDLQPRLVYAVMVRSKLTDGRFSNFSDVVLDNGVPRALSGNLFTLLNDGVISSSIFLFYQYSH